jgi:hypothetical protein
LAVQIRLLRLPTYLKRYSSQAAHRKLKQLQTAAQAQRKHHGSMILSQDFDYESNRSIYKISIATGGSTNSSINFHGSSIILNEEDEADFGNLTHSSSISTLVEESSYVHSDEDEEEEFYDERQQQFLSVPKKKSTNTRCLSILSLNSTSKYSSNNHYASNSTLASSVVSKTIKLDPELLRKTRLLPSLNSIAHMLSNPCLLLPPKCDAGQPIEVIITDVVDCGHFWAQLNDHSHQAVIDRIQSILNFGREKYRLQALDKRDLYPEALCVAYYKDEACGNLLYRAKVINTKPGENKVEVQFVDYGNKQKKPHDEVFIMEEQLKQYPFQAIACRLDNVKPSLLRNPTGVWTKKSLLHFKDLTLNSNDYAEFKVKVNQVDKDNLVLVDLFGKEILY